MATNNASKLTKALSKIVSPSVGSPKRPGRLPVTPDPRLVFKKPKENPVRIVSKVKTNVKKEEPKKPGPKTAKETLKNFKTEVTEKTTETHIKEVKETLSVPKIIRRPPSIPLSPWNADHTDVDEGTSKTTVGGAKKKTLQVPNPTRPESNKIPPLATSKPITNPSKGNTNGPKLVKPKNTQSKGLQRSPTISTKDKIKSTKSATITSASVGTAKCFDGPKTSKPRKTPKEAISEEKKTSTSGETTKLPTTQKDNASSYSTTLTSLQGEIEILSKKLHGIGCLTPSSAVSAVSGVTDEQLEKTTLSELPKFEGKGEITPRVRGRWSLDTISHNIGYFTPYEERNEEKIDDQLKKTPVFLESSDDFTPRVRSRRSLDNSEWSPFAQPVHRVFERQYDNVADALFAPYITDDDHDTSLRSPRFSY